MRIAICDRDAAICSKLETIFQKTMGKYQYYPEEYVNACELYHDIGTKPFFDLILMELTNENLLIVEKILMNISKAEKKFLLIYITDTIQTSDLFFRAINTHPFSVIKKPLYQPDISRLFHACMQTYYENDRFFEFRIRGCHYRIPAKQIRFIQKNGRKLYIDTTDEIYETYCNIQDAYSCLKNISDSFIRIQYSCIINKAYVTRYTHSKIFIGAKEFSISKNFKIS